MKQFFLTCDGEAKQIEIFQKQEIINIFKEKRICLGKTPASCSAICQASDASPFFKAAKKRLQYIPSDRGGGHTIHNYQSDTNLKRLLHSIVTDNTSFSSEKKGLVVKSMMKVAWVVRITLNDDVVMQGYSKTGQSPLSFDAAMSASSHNVSAAGMTIFSNKVDQMVELYRLRGRVTEAEMDDMDIYKHLLCYSAKSLTSLTKSLVTKLWVH